MTIESDEKSFSIFNNKSNKSSPARNASNLGGMSGLLQLGVKHSRKKNNRNQSENMFPRYELGRATELGQAKSARNHENVIGSRQSLAV